MTGAQAAGLPGREADGAAASAVKAMQAEGRPGGSAGTIRRTGRQAPAPGGTDRASLHARAAEADEAVQDAFVKAYAHLDSFREELPFEVWFTRILINGCLDRIKARTRRARWFAPMPEGPGGQQDFAERTAGEGTVAGGTAAREGTAARCSRGRSPSCPSGSGRCSC